MSFNDLSLEQIMTFMDYINQLETHHELILPPLYKQLAQDGMLDWGVAQANWYQEVYPQLSKNPPLLLTSYEFEISSPDELLSYADEFLPTFDNKDWYYLKPEFQDRLVLFATCGNGDAYAFYYADDHTNNKGAEPVILRICHDKESEFVAKNLQDFIVYKLLEIAHIGTDENTDEFRHHLLTQLTTHRPYLTPTQADSLLAIYQGEFTKDDDYHILLDYQDYKGWQNRLIPFDKQDDEIEVFEFE